MLVKNTGEHHTEPQGDVAERNESDCLARPASEDMPAGSNPASPTPDAVAKDAVEIVAEAIDADMHKQGFRETRKANLITADGLCDIHRVAQAAIAAMPYSDAQVRALVEAAYNVVNCIGDDVDTEDALEAALAPFKEAL